MSTPLKVTPLWQRARVIEAKAKKANADVCNLLWVLITPPLQFMNAANGNRKECYVTNLRRRGCIVIVDRNDVELLADFSEEEMPE